MFVSQNYAKIDLSKYLNYELHIYFFHSIFEQQNQISFYQFFFLEQKRTSMKCKIYKKEKNDEMVKQNA
jgi:hypothetical protein